jgi:hypothetical protein
MSVIALALFLVFFLWGFMPLRALFPYLILPLAAILAFGVLIFFNMSGGF